MQVNNNYINNFEGYLYNEVKTYQQIPYPFGQTNLRADSSNRQAPVRPSFTSY